MPTNGNSHPEEKRFLAPEQEELAREIVRMAKETPEIKPSKCACALAASRFQANSDLFMQAISESPVLLVYPPHRDDDLDEIDYYARKTDELCGLGGILAELFHSGDKVRDIIHKESLESVDLQRVAQDETLTAEQVNKEPSIQALGTKVWNFMLNQVSGKFKDKLEDC